MSEWIEVPDEATFRQRVMRAAMPVFVAFETDDCGYCRQQRQLLSRAWRKLSWSVPTLRVDARRLPAVPEAHRIVAYPTFAVFVGGRVAERYPGRRDAADVTRRLHSLLGGSGGLGGPSGLAGPAARRPARAAAPQPRDPATAVPTNGGSR